MDAQERTRSCSRQRMPRSEGTPRGSKQICIPMTADVYHRIWNDAGQVRQFLEPLIQASPELFPQGMQEGYQLTGRLPESEKMPGVRLRQVRLKDGRVFTLRPSFVMSYMTGTGFWNAWDATVWWGPPRVIRRGCPNIWRPTSITPIGAAKRVAWPSRRVRGVCWVWP